MYPGLNETLITYFANLTGHYSHLFLFFYDVKRNNIPWPQSNTHHIVTYLASVLLSCFSRGEKKHIAIGHNETLITCFAYSHFF